MGIAWLPAAPRERGWTLFDLSMSTADGGCPARAGMDPRVMTPSSARCWLPRASGDGPVGFNYTELGRPAAPRERGWTPDASRGGALPRGCPARAGMDPRTRRRWRPGRRLPRASGDGPSARVWLGWTAWAAPRERGWTPQRHLGRAKCDGCPARAGMDPVERAAVRQRQGLPRASGDGPSAVISVSRACLAAPRERGWTRHERARADRAAGCPARAGMDPVLRTHSPLPPRLPRASGDGPLLIFPHFGFEMAACAFQRSWTLISA